MYEHVRLCVHVCESVCVLTSEMPFSLSLFSFLPCQIIYKFKYLDCVVSCSVLRWYMIFLHSSSANMASEEKSLFFLFFKLCITNKQICSGCSVVANDCYGSALRQIHYLWIFQQQPTTTATPTNNLFHTLDLNSIRSHFSIETFSLCEFLFWNWIPSSKRNEREMTFDKIPED